MSVSGLGRWLTVEGLPMSDHAQHEMTRFGLEMQQVKGLKPGRVGRIIPVGEIAYASIYTTEVHPLNIPDWVLCEYDAKRRIWVAKSRQPLLRASAEGYVRLDGTRYRIERRSNVADTDPREKLDCVSVREYVRRGRR